MVRPPTKRAETLDETGSRFYRPRERPPPVRRPGLWLPILVAALGILIYVFLFGENGFLRERQLRKDMQALESEIDALQREGEELKAAIAEVEAGGPEVERLGREQLGLVKENEVTYRLVPTGTTERGLDTEKKNR